MLPKDFDVEFAEKIKPVILLYGNNPLIKKLIPVLSRDLNIILINEGLDVLDLENKENIYQVKKESLSLIENLTEKIDYAVIFFEKEEDKNSVFQLLQKFEKDKTKIALIFNIRSVDSFYDVILELKNKKTIEFLLLGDLFGKTIPFSYSYISKIIQNVMAKKTLTLCGNDLMSIFPISESDAIRGISHILFGYNKKNRIHYLFYKHPQTFISSVHLFKRLEPELDVKFEESDEEFVDKNLEKIESDLRSRIILKPDYLDINFKGFEKSVEKLLDEVLPMENLEKLYKKTIVQNVVQKVLPPVENKKENINVFKDEQNTKEKEFNKKYLFKILGFLLIFFVSSIIFLLVSVFSFKQSISAFQKGDFQSASRYLSIAKITSPLGSIPVKASSKIMGDKASEYQLMDKALSISSMVMEDFSDIKKIGNGEEKSVFEKKIADLYSIYFELERISVETTSQKELMKKLINNDYSKLVSLIQVMPQILGYDNQEKTYLLLFQNNGELRPTGGFIGSVGEISFLNGKITSFLIRDVYEADGQLKGHIEPHYIIRRYLQPHLYLRDSNFSLDYEKSASYSALLYNLETKKIVDGVVAIDYEVLKQVIKEVGPITLSGYNKTLDENNAFEFIQDTIEKEFFPGSTQKKDILNSILNQISLKINDNPNYIFKLASLTPQLLKEKHILFAFRDISVQSVFSVNGFSNSFNDLREKKEGALNDFLSINEANIGVNKANANIKRTIDYKIEIKDKEINSRATLNIFNDNLKAIDYKVYLRFITPAGSVIKSIKINGKEQKTVPAVTDFNIYEAKSFEAPEGLEVDSSIENEKQVFGFITFVPKNTIQKIEITYKNGLLPINPSILNYSLLYVKQPGTQNYPFELNVTMPKEYSLQEENKLTDNTLSLQENLEGDKRIDLKFIKK